VTLTPVNTKAGKTADGQDYLSINPMGLVPALRMADGDILTENAAILPYLADQFPEAGLAPTGGAERSRMTQWLSFIGAELHKAVFTPLLSQTAAPEVKAHAMAVAPQRLKRLDQHLAGREYLLDTFSVADAYLATILNWAQFIRFDLTPYPAVTAYFDRMAARPHVARALREEFGLYQAG
jgi:glutathione S-transferase